MSNYQILATLRYDPHLAKLEEVFESKAEGIRNVTYSTVNDELQLDSKSNGYKWTPDMVEHKEDFIMFQDEFSRLNRIPPRTFTKVTNCEDNLVSNVHYTEFLLSRFVFALQHLNRINIALSFFGVEREEITLPEFTKLLIDTVFDKSKPLHKLLTSIQNDHIQQVYKIRVLLEKSGTIITEAHPIVSSYVADESCSHYFQRILLSGFVDEEDTGPVWDLFKDTEPLVSTTPFTTFKTTNRAHYTRSRERMGEMVGKYRYPSEDKTKSEILVYNEENEVMEGSITNIAVYKGGHWITPPLKSGSLCGIFRYYLLQKGYIQEGKIMIEDVAIGDTVLIFNGVMGCVKSVVRG